MALKDDLVNLEMFASKGAALELLADCQKAVAEIDAARPLTASACERLQNEVLADRVHSSAVTEGNRLSRRETLAVLSTGVIEAGAKRDELEVRNLARAIFEVERCRNESIPLTVQLMRHLNAMVLDELSEDRGEFRLENVIISGASYQPPHFHDVPDLLVEVMRANDGAASYVDPVIHAAWLHWAIARIHPFKDGNGRVARLAQDYILLSRRCVPSALRSEDRDGAYYSALARADAGDGTELVEMTAKNVLGVADKYLAIIRDEKQRASWISNITVAARERIRQTHHRRFLSLQRAATAVKSEFASLAVDINEAIPDLTVRFRDYGSLEFEKFEELEQRGRASRTWYFGIEFELQNLRLRYIFWFGSHHPHRSDIAPQLPSKVVLLVSAEEGPSYYSLLDDLEEDRVSLREIVPDGTEYWRRRFNPVDGKHEWDTDLGAGTIARDFYQEVLGKLGLL